MPAPSLECFLPNCLSVNGMGGNGLLKTVKKDEILSQKERSKRDDPFPIFLAKEAVKVISQRYREQSEHLKDALAAGSKIFQGEDLEPVEGDHPIYVEVKKDIDARNR